MPSAQHRAQLPISKRRCGSLGFPRRVEDQTIDGFAKVWREEVCEENEGNAEERDDRVDTFSSDERLRLRSTERIFHCET